LFQLLFEVEADEDGRVDHRELDDDMVVEGRKKLGVKLSVLNAFDYGAYNTKAIELGVGQSNITTVKLNFYSRTNRKLSFILK
jgi:hypothetical protein